MKIFIGLAFIICFTTKTTAQQPEFRKMLDTLLKHTVKEVNVKQAMAMRKAVFLDARKENEFNVSHIKGAKRVGFTDFSLNKIKEVDKNTPIVVYCSVGYRSEKVAEKLMAAGYTNVSNLYGGIFEWSNQQKPMQDSFGTTNKVHAFNKQWGQWVVKGEKVIN